MSNQQEKTSFDPEQNLNNEAENAKANEAQTDAAETHVEDDTVDAVLDDKLVEALEEVEKFREAALRAQADAQNVRRRAELDVEKAHKFGVEKFAKEVVTVADNLERALNSTEKAEGEDLMREGVELTLKGLLEAMARFEVKPVDPQGEPFNPELHQAMTMVPNPNLEPNTVMDVIQKGYTLHGRLLRPAMVIVSSAG
jgi:molecular chaperone GrpE